jgi:hypothetical protein
MIPLRLKQLPHAVVVAIAVIQGKSFKVTQAIKGSPVILTEKDTTEKISKINYIQLLGT